MYSVAICGFNGFGQIVFAPFQEINQNIHSLGDARPETVSIPVVVNINNGDKPFTENHVKDIVMSWNCVHFVMRDNTVVTTGSWLDRTARNVTKHVGIRSVSCCWKNTFWITVDDRCHFCEQGHEFEQRDTGYKFEQQDTGVVFERQGVLEKFEQQTAESKQEDTSAKLKQDDADLKLDDTGCKFRKFDKSVEQICCIQANNSTNIALTTVGEVLSFELKNTCFVFRELVISDNLHIRSVSCGKHHTLLLADTGSVYSFGTGSHGELGHGTVDNERTPRRIDILDGVKVTAIAAGGWHSVALGSCGEVYVWGWNERGQLGMPCAFLRNTPSNVKDNDDEGDIVNIQTLPQLLDICTPERLLTTQQSSEQVHDNLSTVTKVACGTRHTVVLTEDGFAFAWGWNEYGQLGVGDTIDRDRPCVLEHFVVKRQRVIDVFAGHWNSAFILRDDSMLD